MSARCVVAGGGPAGMMLGLLLARAGVDVQVFEKHADFLRDFRGDTIHPSTLEVMHELGVLDRLLQLPHQKASGLVAHVGDRAFRVADFAHLPVRCPFVAFMPQWDFLGFLATEARRYPTFRLEVEAEVTGIHEEGGRVTAACVTTAAGERDEAADLVVAERAASAVLRFLGLPPAEADEIARRPLPAIEGLSLI